MVPVTPTGIESATFWLVALCLNQLRHRVLHCVTLDHAGQFVYLFVSTKCTIGSKQAECRKTACLEATVLTLTDLPVLAEGTEVVKSSHSK